MLASAIIGVGLYTVGLHADNVSKLQPKATTQSMSNNDKSSPHTVKTPSSVAPVTATPTPAVVAKTSQPFVAPVRTSTSTSKPQPVVTPSPSSSVSSLAPAAVVTTPVTPTTSPSTSTSPPATSQTTTPMATSYTSTNWAGYFASSGTFTSITAAWTVPSATGNGTTTTADSTWIGIGGVSSSDLIQVGTQNTVSANGQVTSGGFYELLPNASRVVPNMNVSAGDAMTATISQTSSGQWTITMTDMTSGGTFSDNVAYASSNSSAEWIEEDPSYSRNRQIPFDDFSPASFISTATTDNGVTDSLEASNAQAITMLNSSGQPVATPSAIGSDGASFTVTRNTNN